MIRGLEEGEIYPFPVWKIPSLLLEINFQALGKNEKDFVKEFFHQRPGRGEIIPFPVWRMPYYVLNINLDIHGSK